MNIIYNDEIYKPDGVLFDVDGTIWDSTGVVTEAWNKALKDTGFGHVQVNADRLKGLFGLPMIDIMRDILPGVDEKELRRFEEVCNEYEENYIINHSGAPYEDIVYTIKELSARVPVIIVSNCQAGYIELMMKHLQIEDYITDHVCPGDSGLLKADNIMMMSRKHNLAGPVYVGDTSMDEEACKKANVPIIYAAYGFGKVLQPAASILKPTELLELI